ncbi:MAG: glycosyltransferase family 2 protein [Lachnospiraceae bacterium]|nr:glycosyltransferase family 2 protein [Lachnospiraceae bacterium]
MEITAVVVTYNRLDLLKENIEALRNQIAPNFHILVVDNNSSDGTRDYLKGQEGDDLECLFLDENLGGAGGFFYGMKKAYEDGADAVWIMDDDTIPKEDALERLLEADEILEHDYGFLASDVRWIDGSPCVMNRVHKLKEKKGSYERIDTATFVSLFIPGETIKQIGLPVKEYFIWGDDKEYTLRASDYKPCYFVPESRVLHKMKVNVGSNICTDELNRIDRYFYAYRNDYVTAKKRGKKSLGMYYLGFCLNFVRVLLKSKNGKQKRVAVMRKGLVAGRNFLNENKETDIM